jgi:hypothetical protein
MAIRIDLNCNTHVIHGKKDGMKLHYPFQGISKMPWGLITYIMTISKVLHNLMKNLEGNQYPNWGIK